MKIKCLHGYFIFEEQRSGEVSDFISLYGLELVPKQNYFTFAELADMPDYSLAGAPLLNTTAIKTFEGPPWEVLEQNDMIFNFNTGLLVPITSIGQRIPLDAAGNYYFSPGLILPGSLTDRGERVKDYAAWFSKDTMKFKYSEVTFV